MQLLHDYRPISYVPLLTFPRVHPQQSFKLGERRSPPKTEGERCSPHFSTIWLLPTFASVLGQIAQGQNSVRGQAIWGEAALFLASTS